MGNSPSTTAPTIDKDVLNDGYVWPENLYEELHDSASLSFLVYTFGKLTDAARTYNGLEGLKLNDDGLIGMPDKDLPRSFSPTEVIELIEKNRDTLNTRYGGEDWLSEFTFQKLKEMQASAQASGLDRPLTVEEYDDKHQANDLVYGVAKDDINKRVFLVFRGTGGNKDSKVQNWKHNLSVPKKGYEVPDVVRHVVDEHGLRMHSGFGDYLFDPVHEDEDEEYRKYDEIVTDVKLVLKECPGYKVVVTGHSLGAALSTLAAFYLTCDPEIPKPVTCLNFASPRVGGRNFLLATRYLEQKRWLRLLRVVNDNDSIAAAPMVNYHHVGFQCRLYKEIGKEPVISYPAESQSVKTYTGRLWQNSLIASFNVGYDHSDYRERVDKDQLFLVKYDLNDLYNETELTGFQEYQLDQ